MKMPGYAAAVLIALCAGILSVCVAAHRSAPPAAVSTPPAAQKNARTQGPGDEIHKDHTLFPELDESAVTAISVSTPQQSFHFLRKGHSAVSVNGSQADGEVFLTLLEQIAELPVDASAAFSPKSDQLLLTLVVSADGTQHTARFYGDGKQGEKALIVAGEADTPQYHRTGGWRVGTLVMTCEGTRIQDAHGNETPLVLDGSSFGAVIP